MVLSVEKLGRALKFPSSSNHHHHPRLDSLSDSLRVFRAKISDFIKRIVLKHEPEGSNPPSLIWLNKCFELINITNKAFAELVVDVDYPMNLWGLKSADEYLNYTLILLELLNKINSSVSHLNKAKLSCLYALSTIKYNKTSLSSSSSSSLKTLVVKINPKMNDFIIKDLRSFERPILTETIKNCVSDPKERLILEALKICKNIGLFALGMVLSGLYGDVKPYMEMRKNAGGFDDQEILKTLDLEFRTCMVEKTMEGSSSHVIIREVKEVNDAIMELAVMADTSGRSCIDHKSVVEEVETRLKVLESCVNSIENMGNSLFSEVLDTRNKLMDILRLAGNN